VLIIVALKMYKKGVKNKKREKRGKK